MSKVILNKESLRNIQTKNNNKIEIIDFMELHRLTELYFRRLLYISLRLNEENDKDAKKMTSLCSLNSNEILEKAINLICKKINMERLDYTKMKNKYTEFALFLRYYINFSSRHRNLYIHGINEDINNKTLMLPVVHLANERF